MHKLQIRFVLLIATTLGASAQTAFAARTWLDLALLRMSAREDLNLDGRVDSADLALILAMYGEPSDGREDLNKDGVVNSADMAEIFAAWTEEPIVRLRHVSGDDQNRMQSVEEVFFLDVSPFESGWTRVWYRHAVNKRAVSVDIPVPLPYADEVLRQRGWDPLQNSTLN